MTITITDQTRTILVGPYGSGSASAGFISTYDGFRDTDSAEAIRDDLESEQRYWSRFDPMTGQTGDGLVYLLHSVDSIVCLETQMIDGYPLAAYYVTEDEITNGHV